MLPGMAWGSLDLARAQVERLSNGLTVILLEDHGFPAVSVQVLYRAGGRNEEYGRTGLAHFLEHMAFRATENFPDTDVVSRIYAAGGEWHGYTWIDQTTYFETVPVAELDTVLQIEADRMTRLKIPAADLESERGAVLSEMHGYENDPASRLHDQLVFVSILGHPYRNNVIGLESDVQKIQLADIRAFYTDNYHTGNAVLAIVGDIDSQAVLGRVNELFGDFSAREPTPLPRTVETVQRGVRRVNLAGPGADQLFEIAYHAPSVRNTDYPAFLVLQELLGGSGGVNFSQDNSVTPVAKQSLLAGLADDMHTWYPPSADNYVFTISGSIGAEVERAELELAVDRLIGHIRDAPVSNDRLDLAITNLHKQLTFDLETTEDAAHQLAYFDGLGALDVLLGLETSLSAVSAEDVMQTARRYLQPYQRSIGWYVPGEAVAETAGSTRLPLRYGPDHAPGGTGSIEKASPALVRHLSSGLPVILQRAPATPTVHVRLLFQGERWSAPALLDAGDPDSGISSLQQRSLATELADTLDALRRDLDLMQREESPEGQESQDPETRLQALLESAVSQASPDQALMKAPLAIVVAGDIDQATVMTQLEARFGDLEPGSWQDGPTTRVPSKRLDAWLDHSIAQAQLGYAVPAPPLSSSEAGPWQALLYVMSHGYEGRLGKAAISNRGLIYYIDSRYHSDRQSGWISLGIGVDPDKFAAMQALLHEQLQGLLSHPPSQIEVDDARRYLLGRYLTQHQSNQERTAFLARQYVQFGAIPEAHDVHDTINAITRDQVLAIVPAFVDGAVVAVRYHADAEAKKRAGD
ncbi:MAG: insulinase family protein [Gammaproteobacteria bacterium]|nr:insulinase family protein [Gammaproteobacteria bacterium]